MSTSAVAGGDEPSGIAISPSGQYVYTANYGTDGAGGVSQYAVGAGGALQPLSTPTVAGGDAPAFLAVSPDQGPVASFTATPAAAGSATSFNGSGSSSSDSTVAVYAWQFGDGTSSIEASSTVSHVYAKAGTYIATLTVEDADGCSALTVFTGQTAYCNEDGGTTTRTVVVPGPAVSGLKVSPKKFAAAGRKVHGKCVKQSKKNKSDKACQLSIKLKASYTLNAAVQVSFKLVRKTAGRKVSGRCVKATKKNKHHSKCTLLVSAHKTLLQSGLIGSNKFSFKGTLAAGTYELTATPAGGASKTVTFTVTG
jgi:PKD domain/Lactonase, 7-bladed beta-propeller